MEEDAVLILMHADHDRLCRPICTLHERTLGVLQCRYVDEVVIGAPPMVTADLLDHFKVDCVVHGKTDVVLMDGINPYQAAIDRKMFVRIESKSTLTAGTLTDRTCWACWSCALNPIALHRTRAHRLLWAGQECIAGSWVSIVIIQCAALTSSLRPHHYPNPPRNHCKCA